MTAVNWFLYAGEEMKRLRAQLRELSKNNNSGFLKQFQGITAGLSKND